MSLSDAISNRNSWQNVKNDLERKVSRLQIAYGDYSSNLYYGEWANLMVQYAGFMQGVDPSLQRVDWEGSRVQEYRERLEALYGSLKIEEGKHYDILTQMNNRMLQYQYDISNAQSNINYWQSVIDNWVEEDE